MKIMVTYIGDGTGSRLSIAFRGVEFALNKSEAIEILTPEGRAMLAKLRGNREFRVVEADLAANPAANPADTNGDGKVDAKEAKAAAKAAKAAK